MLTIGAPFPKFNLEAVISADPATAFKRFSAADIFGQWSIFFAWPKDFTFVCPTEIAAFDALLPEFETRGARLFGLSTDSEYAHLAWRQSHPDLRKIGFPMLSDIRRQLASDLGILHPEQGVCLRATFIVDAMGIIRFAAAQDLDVGRNAAEVLRLLDALQTGALTPCNWLPGDPVLTAA